MGGPGGQGAVVLGGAVAELPGPVHLVAEAPDPHTERSHAAVGDAAVGQRCSAVVIGVLEELSKPEFLNAVADAGLFLESELQKLSARHGLGEVRGRGLLLALDLKLPIGAAIVAEAFAEGVLINSPQPDALRFMPALNVTREEISLMIDCLDAILVKAGAARRVA